MKGRFGMVGLGLLCFDGGGFEAFEVEDAGFVGASGEFEGGD